jgi:hypothetical protein
MGPEELHAEAALSIREGELSSYLLLEYAPGKLPEAYFNFVLSRWLRTFKRGNDYMKLVRDDAYYKAYEPYLKRLLDVATVRLAVLSDDRDVTLGFAVARGNVLDYICVHPMQQFQGIATQLLPEGIDTITHLTRTGLTIWANKYPKLVFNPFA